MKPGQRALIAFLTFSPFLPIVAVSFILAFALPRHQMPDDFLKIAPNLLKGVGVLFAAAFILTFVGLIFSIVHLVSDKRRRSTAATMLWMFMLLFMGNIGQVSYYFARVRRHHEEDGSR
jgi:ABC-type uncharacterized transport system YnjBCD permease subunit